MCFCDDTFNRLINRNNFYEAVVIVFSWKCPKCNFLSQCRLNNLNIIQICENLLVFKCIAYWCPHTVLLPSCLCWGSFLKCPCGNISWAVGSMLRLSCHKLLICYFYPLIWLCSVVTCQRNYTLLHWKWALKINTVKCQHYQSIRCMYGMFRLCG